MECPLCGTRNLPGTPVCNACGAILHEIKRARPVPKEKAHAGGGLAGAARALFGGGKAKAQCSAVQGKIKSVLDDADAAAQTQIKAGTATGQTRLNLALVHVFKGEIERAVQEYQLAQKAGAAGPEFYNNAGVSLARRGHLGQSLNMYPHALQHTPAAAPHANAAHAITLLWTGANPETLSQAAREALSAAGMDTKNPAHNNRLGWIFCQQELYAQAQSAFTAALTLANSDTALAADAHCNRGAAFALDGDLASAAAQFTLALEREPCHARAQANHALLSMSQGDWDTALERLHRAAHTDPQDALVRNNHGCILSRLLAINEGIREFKEAGNINSHFMEPLFNQAKSYADEGLYDFAERYLSRAAPLAPRAWQPFALLGAVKIGLGQFAGAVTAFGAARPMRPQDIAILTGLGLAQALAGHDTAALSVLEEASRLAPKDPDINLYLAWLYLRQGQTSAASAECAIALERQDASAVAHNNLGLCEADMTNPTEALRHFRCALQIEPNLAPVHYQLGCAYALLNDMPSAIREWEQNAKEEPGNADCYSNLGVAYYKAGKMEQAVTEFRRVITIRQTRLDDFSNLGLAYAKQGMALKAAVKKPDDPRLKDALEKHKLAIDMFDRAIALQPNNVMLHSNRGLACYFANRAEEAMKEWGVVSRLDPGYARRRAAKQQSEFDETQVNFIPLNVKQRAMHPPLRTPDYIPRYAFSYDLDDWEMIVSDPALSAVPALLRHARQCERAANAS